MHAPGGFDKYGGLGFAGQTFVAADHGVGRGFHLKVRKGKRNIVLVTRRANAKLQARLQGLFGKYFKPGNF
jgi:hypothetical protein